MLYIIEGPDKCGKSTFIKRNDIDIWCEGIEDFQQKISTLTHFSKIAVHFDANDKDPVRSLGLCIQTAMIHDVYMDRSWISEMVYGVVYRGEMNIKPIDEGYILWLLQKHPHIIYYFDKPIAETDNKDIFEKDAEKMELVKVRYNQIIARYKHTLNIYEMEAVL